MSKSLIKQVALYWFYMLVIAFTNGMIRQLVVTPVVGDAVAHIIACVIGCTAFFFLIRRFVRRNLRLLTVQRSWMVGAVWLIVTVVFEFGMGLSTGRSWEYMLHDYNLLAGRFWIFILATELVMPVFFYQRFSKWNAGQSK